MNIENLSNIVYLTDNAYIIIGMVRPGSYSFITYLEHEIFPPDNEESNDKFHLHLTRFEGVPYTVVGFPQKFLPDARKIADRCGMKLITGVPLSQNESDSHQFPINHSLDLTFTLENMIAYTAEELGAALIAERDRLQQYYRLKFDQN